MFEREDTPRNRIILSAMEREVDIMENEVHQRKMDTVRRLMSWYEGPFVINLERYGYVEVAISDLALVAPFRVNKDLRRRIEEVQSDLPF